MKIHPDKVRGEEEKKEATAKFQDLSNSYQSILLYLISKAVSDEESSRNNEETHDDSEDNVARCSVYEG